MFPVSQPRPAGPSGLHANGLNGGERPMRTMRESVTPIPSSRAGGGITRSAAAGRDGETTPVKAPARPEACVDGDSACPNSPLMGNYCARGGFEPIAYRFALAAEFPLGYKPVFGLHAAAIWV